VLLRIYNHYPIAMKTNAPNTKVARGRKGRKRDSNKNEVARFAGDAYDLCRRALQGVSYLKNLINIEIKSVDNYYNLLQNSALTCSLMFPLAQGITNGARVGDSVKIQRVEFSATFYRHASATSSTVRLILFRDNRCNGSSPSVADLFLTNDSSMLHQPLRQYAQDTERFGILYDTTVDLSSSNYRQTVKASIPHNGHIKYIGTTAAVGSHGAGTIFLACWSTENTNTPAIDWYARLLYTDD
jgi:hypothetical protein